MKREIGFNSQIEVARWVEDIASEPTVTKSDAEELGSHLLDLIDELKTSGLDDEEAFLIASKRIGDSSEWGNDYSEANNSMIQMRKTLVILSGVLVYFILYYFLRLSTVAYFIYSHMHQANEYVVAEKIYDFLIWVQFAFGVLFIYFFFFGKRVIFFIEVLKVTPLHAVVLLSLAITSGIMNNLLIRFTRMLGPRGSAHLYHEVYRYFDFSFPFIFCLGFVLLFYRYDKKAID